VAIPTFYEILIEWRAGLARVAGRVFGRASPGTEAAVKAEAQGAT
jgi:hypothetical protein